MLPTCSSEKKVEHHQHFPYYFLVAMKVSTMLHFHHALLLQVEQASQATGTADTYVCCMI
jgi:hypothetical protein